MKGVKGVQGVKVGYQMIDDIFVTPTESRER